MQSRWARDRRTGPTHNPARAPACPEYDAPRSRAGGSREISRSYDLQQLTCSQRRPNATAAPGPGFGELPECLACVLMALSATCERLVRLIELRPQLRHVSAQDFKLEALLVAQFDTPVPSLIGLSHRPVFAARPRAPARAPAGAQGGTLPGCGGAFSHSPCSRRWSGSPRLRALAPSASPRPALSGTSTPVRPVGF